MLSSEIEVYNKAREVFINKRAEYKAKVDAWARSLEQVDPDIFVNEGIDLPSPLTLENLIPEWFAEKPRKEVCRQQLDEVRVLADKINTLVARYNKEALKCLSEYEVLSSATH